MRIILYTLFIVFSTQLYAIDDCLTGKKSENFDLILTENTVAYTTPKLCKPLAASNFKVVKGYDLQVYKLGWSKQDHHLWHVSSYEVKQDGDRRLVTTYDANQTLPIYIDHTGSVSNHIRGFEVRVCATLLDEESGRLKKSCSVWQRAITQENPEPVYELCENAVLSQDYGLVLTEHTVVYGIPKICKPRIINKFGVVKHHQPWDSLAQEYKLEWKTSYHDLWHVSHYEIKDENDDITSHNSDLPLFLRYSNINYDYLKQFQVRACSTLPSDDPLTPPILEVCGDWKSTSTTCFQECTDGSLARPVLNSLVTSTTGDYRVSWNSSTNYSPYRLDEKVGNDNFQNEYTVRNKFFDRSNQTNHQTYTYQVRGCNRNVCSHNSDDESVNIELEVPNLILDDVSTTGDYLVRWGAVNYDVNNYELQEKTQTPDNNQGPWSTVYSGLEFKQSIQGRPNGHTYSYQIRACRANNNCSDFSEVQSINVLLTPDIPELTVPSQTSTTGGYTVSWTQENYTTRYNLKENGVSVSNNLSLSYDAIENHNGSYAYKVKACNVKNNDQGIPEFQTCSEFSNTEIVNVDRPILERPEAPVQDDDDTTPLLIGKITHQDGTGPIPGSAGVSGGAASYNLPIFTPPGRNGMTPSVSVNYSSKGGNGILGVGWSVSAGSSIYLCPKTLAQDEVNHSVDFSDSDRLCLDGQRLMTVNLPNTDESYWLPTAQYRTEQDSFAKISKVGQTYIVKTKSGRTNTYVQKGTQETTWQLVKEQDSFGNTIAYKYNVDMIPVESHGTNEILLRRILYTGYLSTDGNRSIDFNYINRGKNYQSSYLHGKKTVSTQRLDKIIIKAPEDDTEASAILTKRTYTFKYEDSNPSLLLLTQINEIANESGTLRTLADIEWQGNYGYDLISPTHGRDLTAISDGEVVDSSTKQLLKSMKIVGDYDGDGKKDIFVGEGNITILLYNSDGTYDDTFGVGDLDANSTIVRSLYHPENKSTNIYDFDENGIADIFYRKIITGSNPEESEFKVASWNANTSSFKFLKTNLNHYGVGASSLQNNYMPDPYIIDVNNDGKPDVVYIKGNRKIEPHNQCTQGINCEVRIYYRLFDNFNAGTETIEFGLKKQMAETLPFVNWVASYPVSIDYSADLFVFDLPIEFNDLDGNGLPDVIIKKTSRFYNYIDRVYFATKGSAGIEYQEKSRTDIGLYDDVVIDSYYNWLVDLNGDGLQDFLFACNNGGNNSLDYCEPANNVGDMNLYYRLNTGQHDSSIFETNATKLIQDTIEHSIVREGLFFSDVDGDGIDDLLVPDKNNILIDVCTGFALENDVNDGIWTGSGSGTTTVFPNAIKQVCANSSNGGATYYVHDSLKAYDKSVYGHIAFLVQPQSDGSIQLKADKNDMIPSIYRKISNSDMTTSGDLFGNGQESFINSFALYLSETKPTAVSPGPYYVKEYVHFPDVKNQEAYSALQTYKANNYPSNWTLNNVKANIKDNIIIGFSDADGVVDDVTRGEVFITKNTGTMPGLVSKITKPTLNQSVDWIYQPLSVGSEGRPADFPLYSVPDRLTDDSYVDEDPASGDHFYFSSSMYVVAEMLQTNNYGTQSVSQFSYEEAVYNNKGRGFQGFRKIAVKSNPSDGSIYETVSESVFHQVFPYAGKLLESKTYQDNKLISEEIYNYVSRDNNISLHSGSGVHFHPLIEKQSIVYEPNAIEYYTANGTSNVLNQISSDNIYQVGVGDLISSCTPSIGYDSYGNIVCQASETNTYNIPDQDTNPNTVPVASTISKSEKTTTTNTYDSSTSIVNEWWIDKLELTKVEKELVYQVPASPESLSNIPHRTTSKFIWQAGVRKLDCQLTALGFSISQNCDTGLTSNNTSRNIFTYDSDGYGNITTIESEATNHLQVESSRSVTTTYSDDGYFPVKIEKPTNNSSIILTSELNYDLGTGQVLNTIAPDNNTIDTIYDAFGVQTKQILNAMINPNTQITETSAPDVHSAINNCSNIDCSTVQDIINTLVSKIKAAYPISSYPLFIHYGTPQLSYAIEQRQDGQPQTVTYFDNGNSPVLTQSWHSNGKTSYTVSITNPLGVVEVATQPFANVNNAYSTIQMSDSQGRIVEKITQIGDLADLDDSNNLNCQINTFYDHTGGFTKITVTKSSCAENDSLIMSRRYDVSGKLMSTSDALSYVYNSNLNDYVFVPGHTVNYWYGHSGNPQVLQDADGNNIVTKFDALGRKTEVIDPNMGSKNFSYNGFGEVIQQYNSQGLYNFYEYDKVGRLLKQYSNVNSSKSPLFYSQSSTYERAYIDEYVYDPVSAIGQLASSSRTSNYGSENESSFSLSPEYTKTNIYDEFARVEEELTSISNALTTQGGTTTSTSPRSYSTKYYYDGYYNRLKQVNYQGGLGVANIYTKYGSLKTQNLLDFNFVTNTFDIIPIMQVIDYNFRGQEVNKKFDNNTTITNYYPSTGQTRSISNQSAGINEELLKYDYDGWGNIETQKLNRIGTQVATATETFIYDKLHRLEESSVTGVSTKYYAFDNIGNITKKSDFSNIYQYGATGNGTTCETNHLIDTTPGPNAVTKANNLVNGSGSINYFYDKMGNRILDCLDDVKIANYEYDYNNLLIRSNSIVTGTSQIVDFSYGTDQQRYRKIDTHNQEITLYANKDYEQIFDTNGTLLQQKYYLTNYLTITMDRYNYITTHSMQKDRLGSTTQIIDESGSLIHTKSYDAFGKPRNGDWSDMGNLFEAKLDFNDPSPNDNVDLSKRGFTDHEHLDEMQLIHMNGRMYDYNNGRFLSVDPFIQSPTSTQSMNPYTYIFNNPLSGVDPTGYMSIGQYGASINGNTCGLYCFDKEKAPKNSGDEGNDSKPKPNGGDSSNINNPTGVTKSGVCCDFGVIAKSQQENAKNMGAGEFLSKGFGEIVSDPETYIGGQIVGEAGAIIDEASSGVVNGRRAVEAIGITDIATGLIESAKEISAGEYTAAATTVVIAIVESKFKVKSLKEQASDLIKLNNNKNRVTIRSENQMLEIDLDGKAHHNKTLNVDVDTPHTKVSPRNRHAPNQPAYNTKNNDPVNATQQDIRTARRYLERKNRNKQ